VYTGSAAPTNAETVTIGSIVYTFKTALAGPFDVLIGSLSATLDNLKAAINHAPGEGSTYGYGTQAHPLVAATTKTSTGLVIQAKLANAAANSIGTTATTAAGSWGQTTMTYGADAATSTTNTSASPGSSIAIDDLQPTGYLLRLTVNQFAAAAEATAHALARFSFPDSVNAFSASLPGPSFAFQSPVLPGAPVERTITSRDYPGLRLGVASAVIACNLDALTAGATITYTAEIEQ
jgi:hypothetical protein